MPAHFGSPFASLVGTVEFSQAVALFPGSYPGEPGCGETRGAGGRCAGAPGRGPARTPVGLGVADGAAAGPDTGWGDHRYWASLAVQTLNETGFRVCLALALYGVTPTITLAAVLVLARAQRGRAFLAGVALGARLLVPAGIALASLVG